MEKDEKSTLEPTGAEKTLGAMPSFEEFRRSIEENEESKNGLSIEIKSIVEKFGYSEEITTTLEMIVPAIVEYYDNQEAVLEVLRDCPIFIIDPNDRMSEEANEYLGRDERIPTRASGGACIVPSINEDGEVEVRKAIIIKNSKNGVSTLVHEICHQVASLGKEPQLCPDGRIRIDIGFSSEFYKENDDGEMELVEAINNNLEEMMNSRDETLIMQKIMGSEYEGNGYGALRYVARECPPEVIKKLQELRFKSNPSENIASQELLKQASENLDDMMNVPKRIRIAREMAEGDKSKESQIEKDLRIDSVKRAIEYLTRWGREPL